MSHAPLLSVNDLHVRRGRVTILDGVRWRIEAGQHWTILGGNGSGKTSLLKALTGYLSPTRGEIEVLGRRYGACDWRDLRLQIGVVTSAFASAIPPAEPAIETVVSGKFAQLDLWSPVTRADRSAARKLLRLMGVVGIANREWAYLSQGERQRVLIARALMARPRLLILDEPCAGLDPVAREKFLRFLARFGRRRHRIKALILVTHHVEEIVPCFSHVLLLRAGQVVAAGPAPRVLNSANLSAAFSAPIRVRRVRGEYQLTARSRRAHP
jgi:iron complex transport system ATP-binding protein